MATADIVSPEEDKPMADEAVKSAVKGKRKAEVEPEAETETCSAKKAKTINEGFCVFIGNLNKTKTYEEIKTSLVNYLMTESVLFQDIRLDTTRTFAYVDLASEFDLTKALSLSGNKVLDLPLRISKAKLKDEKKKKKRVKATVDDKAAKFSKWLSVTNLPRDATKSEIMSIFNTAVDLKFPGGTTGPSKGTAIVHFETTEHAVKALKKKRGKKLRDCVIKVNPYRSKSEAGEKTPGSAATNTLLVKNLPFVDTEAKLKKLFKTAVGFTVPKDGSKARGFAFVEFKTVADAKEAMEKPQDMKILKKEIQIEYSKSDFRPVVDEVVLTSLIVMGLTATTSEETLRTAFDGCSGARIIRDKKTAASKGFGFVDFAEKAACQAAKESMEDCEIDGKKVTVAYAKAQVTSAKPKPKDQQEKAKSGDQPAAEQANGHSENKPEDKAKTTQDEPKPSGDVSKRSKRQRKNKKKGLKRAAQDDSKDGAKDAKKEVEVTE